MRKKIGVVLVLLGIICILGSVGLVIYNQIEAQKASHFTNLLLEEAQNKIDKDNQEENIPSEKMSLVSVGEYDCIGILSIPVLELELPVLADWSYAKLKKAPCHYYGSYLEKDFVIAAHNYKAHFGRISELQQGDFVIFTDAEGVSHHYEVELLETLQEHATKEMIVSGFDLSLYTCTLGGGSRVTVRCNAVQLSQ